MHAFYNIFILGGVGLADAWKTVIEAKIFQEPDRRTRDV